MTVPAKRPRTANEQFEFEQRLIEEARDEIRSGLTMDEAEVEAWLASLDGDVLPPLPELRSPRKTAS